MPRTIIHKKKYNTIQKFVLRRISLTSVKATRYNKLYCKQQPNLASLEEKVIINPCDYDDIQFIF